MDLDDLKRTWDAQNAKLEASLRLNARVLRESVLATARGASRWAGLWILVEILLAVVPVVWLGSFLADHIREPRFWIPAAVLDAGAIAVLAAFIRQLATLHAIDWSGPVAAIQRRLEEVRLARIRATRWTFFLSPLLWVPLLVVAARGLLGADVYTGLDPAFLIANVLFGLVFLGLAIWVSRRYAERLGRYPLVQQLLRDLGGRNLADAERTVASIEQFEADPGR